ncbi:hypothetical protein EJ04DRAFT_512167 [Polyplosphaeria fusca]|uniref:EDC4-like protein pdc1 beta-propeller domain-containing protein n=1 Tax=Polyplosphaeria fusca TaxID=682080 RepID=A0A9P4V024_9PLEO|nr:hypothetical protein EJ04DRAFT_512167 [Polyplosphaeria fusca]
MADLQELIARLSGQGAAGASPGSQAHGYQQPAVSSPVYSPSPGGPHPHHQSAVISPNMSTSNTPGPEQPTPQQQSAQLLNLLRFNSQPSVAQSPAPLRHPSSNIQPADGASGHGRATSASDLVASFMGRPSSQAASQASATGTPALVARAEQASASENPQDLLLRLLNHPKPAQADATPSRSSIASFASPPTSKLPETEVDDLAQDLADAKLEKVPFNPATRGASPMRIFGADGAGQSSDFEPETASKPKKFTYVNPFEQLEAASPRNRSPAPTTSKSSAPKMEILKPKPGPVDEAPTPTPASHPHETVAKAVSDLGQQVGQEVGDALAEAEGKFEAESAQAVEDLSPEEVKEIQEAIHDTAVEIKKELEDETNVRALEQTLPKPLADALKEVVSEVAQGEVADSWESAAEDSPSKDEDDTVFVYRFPMKAFSSITVKSIPSRRPGFPRAMIMDIARLKKEFDQIDRSLVAASKNFIVYALAKKAGIKIIRQSNGLNRPVFENVQERIFNVAICTAGEDTRNSVESMLGIGVNGTVFWTSIDVPQEDQFSDDIATRALILPPSPAQDDNTSGGQLKTRAKPSSRHPEFFAVGRGKSIHIVWPKVAIEYVNRKDRTCNTEKYLKERSLKILTGKAGKDFSFSEDDTVIVSLDKAGRMRFWDIRKLTDPELGHPRNPPKQLEVSQTLLEFHTTSPTAKSWPTSVFFFDKDKPFNKGIALRYVMVGMKQNHSFQLWDLGLGKAVQEINLPHEKESDAICSVAFHPKSGIMAVAHPTRNSIFFVHVSCPRYNLPVFSQAAYIGRLATKNEPGLQQLPAVNATAIMTSITEYSFASKGQIRSLHMLNDAAGPPDSDDPDNAAYFELYVMHSKGLCTIRVRRSDLGWKKDGEPLYPRDAEDQGVISIATLKPPQTTADESSTGGDTPAQKSSSERSTREGIKKEASMASRQSMTPEAAIRASTLAKVESKQDAARAAIINGGEKSEKKKKKRSAADTASQTPSAVRPPPPSYAQAAQATPRSNSPSPPEAVITESTMSKASESEAPEWAQKLADQVTRSTGSSASAPAADTAKFEEIVQAEITKGFSRELDVMYKRFDEAQRSMNAANGAKQEALLRLVSSTLTDNVEVAMKKMVEGSVRDLLLPQVVQNTTNAVEKTVGDSLKPTLARELGPSLTHALKNTHVFQSLPETVAKKVAADLGPVVAASVGQVVNPAVSNLSNHIREQLHEAQAHRQEDSAKIQQLTDTVRALSQTVQSMATNQVELQNQLAKVQQLLVESSSGQATTAGRSSPTAVRSPPVIKRNPEQIENDNIARLITDGNFEGGTMAWLQSTRSAELFDTVFVHCNPSYLNQVSPLLALSTGAVVSSRLDTNLLERLVWLDAVLQNINPHDPEILDLVPKIMDVIKQRLTTAYINLNETQPGSILLRRISTMVTKANDMGRSAASHASHRQFT